MSELKTKPTNASVSKFLNSIEDQQKKADSKKVSQWMEEITGDKPKMWGPSIVGFGSYHYKYASGREGDWFLAGFSPRKQSLTLYIMGGFKKLDQLMQKLGKFKTGKGCLYVNKLADVDDQVLKKLISKSVAQNK